MKRPYGRTAVIGGKKKNDLRVRYVGANEFGHTHSRTYSDSKSPFSRSNVFRSRLNPTLDPLFTPPVSVKRKHNLAGVSLHPPQQSLQRFQVEKSNLRRTDEAEMRGKAPADPSALIGQGLGRASGYIYAAISHPITSAALKGRRGGAAGKLHGFHSTSGEPRANNCRILELGDIKQGRVGCQAHYFGPPVPAACWDGQVSAAAAALNQRSSLSVEIGFYVAQTSAPLSPAPQSTPRPATVLTVKGERATHDSFLPFLRCRTWPW